MNEDMQEILGYLCAALKCTRGAEDLVCLQYFRISAAIQIVVAYFENGSHKEINVSLDSGMAMICDVVNHIGY